MANRVAIVGAGVSGLTCGVLLAEAGLAVSICAEEIRRQTTSGAAGAIWFPYDCEPRDKVITWAFATYEVLTVLARQTGTGVSMIELRQFCRAGELPIPDWAKSLGATFLSGSVCGVSSAGWEATGSRFPAGFILTVPLTDTTIYLDYLTDRFRAAGGVVHQTKRFEQLEEIDPRFDLIINCAGFGAKILVQDADLVPHRGQVAIMPKVGWLRGAVVCDDPLMYVIARTNDCVFGGTNEISADRAPSSQTTAQIVAECSRVLGIDPPTVLEQRVGIRPFRKPGVRLERGELADHRPVIHNYGHGGSGFTLSWGCATEVAALANVDS